MVIGLTQNIWHWLAFNKISVIRSTFAWFLIQVWISLVELLGPPHSLARSQRCQQLLLYQPSCLPSVAILRLQVLWFEPSIQLGQIQSHLRAHVHWVVRLIFHITFAVFLANLVPNHRILEELNHIGVMFLMGPIVCIPSIAFYLARVQA